MTISHDFSNDAHKNNDESLQSEMPVAFQGEVMLKDWNDSSRDGRTVTFRLGEDDLEHPFRAFAATLGKKAGGQRFMAVMVMIDDQEEPVKEAERKPFGKEASALHRRMWFNDKRVLAAFGTPEEFRAWGVNRPCVMCKMSGPSHVLRGPGFTAIPACQQHRHADVATLVSHQAKVQKEWVSQKICEIANVESMGFVPPKVLRDICSKYNILHTLPEEYME